MRSFALLVAPVLALLSSVAARSSTGDRVLVVLEPQITKNTYSQFWSSLEGRGYKLTFKRPKDEAAELVRYGQAQYDHLIMFTPSSKSYAANLAPKSVLDAQFSGLNTLYLLSSNMSELNRDTFREYDLEFSERDSLLIDAFSHPSKSPASTVLLPSHQCLVPNGAILSPETLAGGPIVYPAGTVHSLGQNPYLVDILHGTKTSYIGEEGALGADEAEVERDVSGKGGKEAVLSGKKAVLVSAMQTRDNVRVGFVGSGAMFGDEWWGKSVAGSDGVNIATGNADFAQDVTKWIFQETGVIKVVSTSHRRADETEPREMYRIKDDLVYTLDIASHDSSSNGTSQWTAVSLPDLQLDFTMLDPHVRTALVEGPSGSGRGDQTSYTAKFVAPDRHGVFKFVVEYWRPGWSYIRTSSTASVVPFRHDEYPRFIKGAWPFYSAAISMSATFLLFCVLWTMVGEKDTRGKKKTE